MSTIIAYQNRSVQLARWLPLSLVLVYMALVWATPSTMGIQGDEPIDPGQSGRSGYVIDVPLPLVGERDGQVSQELRRLSESVKALEGARPIVVLNFRSSTNGQGPENQLGSRGSQFERSLALARMITDRTTANLRIVAYLSETIEGHAVLPVLACQEIWARPGVELGRAGVDSDADITVKAAYLDMVARGRTNIPAAAVEAMLTPNVKLYRVSQANQANTQVVTAEEAQKLKEAGLLSETHESIWEGVGLAAFTAERMRSWLWISPLVDNLPDLTEQLGIGGRLRTIQQLPREWRGRTVQLQGTLDAFQTNQLIRRIAQAKDELDINLIVLLIDDAQCDFDDATRLAGAIADLRGQVYMACYVQSSLRGPIGLVAAACHETVLIGQVDLGPNLDQPRMDADRSVVQRVLADLAARAQRPLPLLVTLVDKEAEANIYTHQITGKRELFSAGQVAQQVERDNWLPTSKVAGGQPIPTETAIQYGLVNAAESSVVQGLSRLGLGSIPERMEDPWLDHWISKLLANTWIPRVLLMIGIAALLTELGNPGIGIGGLTAGLCFLGYFWIESFNGNVEWLEILLFVGGLVCLAIEVFALPGFGVFGITGLLMLFLSLVLAGQTFVWPSNSVEFNQMSSNLFWVALLGFAGMIGLLFLHQRLESLPMFRWLSLQPGGTDELEELEQREIVADFSFLTGQIGTTKTRLNPSGKAQFGDTIISVVGSGGLIDQGVPVQVVEVRGNLVIVEEQL